MRHTHDGRTANCVFTNGLRITNSSFIWWEGRKSFFERERQANGLTYYVLIQDNGIARRSPLLAPLRLIETTAPIFFQENWSPRCKVSTIKRKNHLPFFSTRAAACPCTDRETTSNYNSRMLPGTGVLCAPNAHERPFLAS